MSAGAMAPAALPAAARPFVAFAPRLRASGFAVAPEQTVAFLAAVGLLGPRGMGDIRAAALATLAPPPERRAEFDALFAAHFLGRTLEAPAEAGPEDDDETRLADGDAWAEPPEAEQTNESGAEAARAEVLGLRAFEARDADAALRRLRREAAARLPRRLSRRRAPARRGESWDMRRALREAARRDGEALTLPRRRRRPRLRRLCLLIDVSGSMKARTEAHLRVAHALTQAAGAVETFTLGTRLTRVTRALRLGPPEQALARAAGMVADWDGGTRLGDALAAFLAVPRFLAAARGAAVLAISDGLERGAPDALAAAVPRLRRAAWRLFWLSPLAAEPGYRPETAAMRALLPHLDALLPAADTPTLVAQALALRAAAEGRRR